MRASGSRILLFAATVGLAACSSKESALVKPAGEGQHPAAVGSNRQQQVSILRRKVASLMEKKHYLQAIESMNGRNREGLEREYILAVNGLLETGNDAYSSGDYATAARSFKGVLNAYPAELLLRSRASYDPKRTRALLENCMNRMMEQGLEEYRRGSLESAINKWRALLSIRPDHQEAKKALDTATVQLQALQGMKEK